MQDTLTVIDSLIQEHAGIKGHMKSVSSLAEDWKGMALFDRYYLTSLPVDKRT